MRLLARNRQTVYYRNYKKMTAIASDGIETGEYTKTYDTMQTVKAYVKSAIGGSDTEPFGDFSSKQRTIYYKNGEATINEYSQVWVGIDPALDNQGAPTVPYNFDVVGVSVGLNHTRVSIRKVEKSV